MHSDVNPGTGYTLQHLDEIIDENTAFMCEAQALGTEMKQCTEQVKKVEYRNIERY